jgi:hypothetical protein
MTCRAVARSATMEMRCMMPAFARDCPPSSLSEILLMNSSSSLLKLYW